MSECTYVTIRHLPWVRNEVYARDKKREVLRSSLKQTAIDHIHIALEHELDRACCKIEPGNIDTLVDALVAETELVTKTLASYGLDARQIPDLVDLDRLK